MKALTRYLPMMIAACSAQAAESQAIETATRGALKLEQEKNYAWVSTSQSAPETRTWRQGPTEGKTEKGGYTYVTFTLGDNTILMGFKDKKAAISWADRWQGAEELQGDYAWIGDRLRTYKLPASEATFLAKHSRNLKEDASGSLAGELDEAALKWLLTRGRQEITDVAKVKGSVQFWLQNGRLAKYEYVVQGALALKPDEPEVKLHRTTTVEIKNVGSTKVDVPREAAEKLK